MSHDQAARTGVVAIESEDLTRPFADAWRAAGMHIVDASGGRAVWLRNHLHQPMAEHLSFTLGNRLFFVFVEALERHGAVLPFAAQRAGRFLYAARVANAVPCRIEVARTDGGWAVARPGWGLTHAEMGYPVDPEVLVDDRPVEMTEWELHDFAIQVVRDCLLKDGKQVTEWQSNLDIDPSIWFGHEGRRCWVVVRAVRYPDAEAPRPPILEQLTVACAPNCDRGYFASVAAVNSSDPCDGSAPVPLLRGCGMYVRFTGLELLE